MSHVVKVECTINDLDALEVAVSAFNAKLVRDKRHFQMYGTESEPCFHAIVMNDAKPKAYEIGLRQKTTNPADGFELAFDPFDSSLTRTFGSNLEGLTTRYSAAKSQSLAHRAGLRTSLEVVAPNLIYVRAYA